MLKSTSIGIPIGDGLPHARRESDDSTACNDIQFLHRRRRKPSLVAFSVLYSLGLLLLLGHHPVHSFVPNTISTSSRSTTALTGIKGFRSWFESQFPDAILELPRNGANEEFDHVLIDMNQLLHISLRRARSEGHSLTILMKELDACCALATPKKSLVLAMDGPPSAAKLATQRRRRFSTFVRAQWKQEQLTRLKKAFSKQDEARRRRRYSAETKTLRITPGTAFMDKAQQALLYWAWQRMQNPNNPLSRVKIHISSSNVHGEGEVKLLDWILQRNRNAESIAILGGDSDLVLEGLVIPPSSSHNIFVLLPDGNKRYFSVSLWETTRALSKFLPKLKAADVMRVRTDMVLLLILNGNDYLPKLRGSSGFNKVFHTYLRLLHQWLDDKEAHPQEPFLVDPDTLEFNIPFCLAFFRNMAQLAPSNYLNETYAQQPLRMSRVTPLGQLNDLVDSEFVPQPLRWTLVSPEDEDVQLSMDDMDSDVNGENDADTEDENADQLLMRLTLGQRGTEEFYEYEAWHTVGVQLKKTKHRLALMALDDLLGTDYCSDESIRDDDEDGTYPGITSSGYAWEVQYAVPGKVDRYLAGLLWNLQTYQDGVCADYAYNYGRRMSPTALEIVDFFKEAIKENRTLGRDELLGDTYSHAVSAGLSCLAALPSQVRDLIPEPYTMLSNTTVEEIYASCMDPEDNCFDMKLFQSLCEERIRELAAAQAHGIEIDTQVEAKFDQHGRRILTGDHYWTVLSRTRTPLTHPFDPPSPFSSRLSNLRPNRRIKVTRAMATAEPRPRSVWSKRKPRRRKRDAKGRFVQHEPREVKHADLGDLLTTKNGKKVDIIDVEYKRAYQDFEKQRGKKKARRKGVKFELKTPNEIIVETNNSKAHKRVKKRLDFDVAARMREFKVIPPLKSPQKNVEGCTAMSLLNQLCDTQMIGDVTWNYTTPSPSSYATVDPHAHEHIQLVVKKGPDSDKAILHEDLIFEQDRDVNSESRQSLRHHLSSLALCEILGPQKRWSEMSCKEMKGYLKQQRARETKSRST